MVYKDKPGQPPYPEVQVRIVDNRADGRLPYPLFRAMVDTGASCTCIPEWAIPANPKPLKTKRTVEYADGRKEIGEFLIVPNAELEILDDTGQTVATITRRYLNLHILRVALLGRDMLNECVCTLDGPRSALDIRQ
jgi:hypothetical protein